MTALMLLRAIEAAEDAATVLLLLMPLRCHADATRHTPPLYC